MWVWSVFVESEDYGSVLRATFENEWGARAWAESHANDCFRAVVKHQLLNDDVVKTYPPGEPVQQCRHSPQHDQQERPEK